METDFYPCEHMNCYELRTYDSTHDIVLRTHISPKHLELTEYLAIRQEKRLKKVSGKLTFYKNKAKMRGITLTQRILNRLIEEIQ